MRTLRDIPGGLPIAGKLFHAAVFGPASSMLAARNATVLMSAMVLVTVIGIVFAAMSPTLSQIVDEAPGADQPATLDMVPSENPSDGIIVIQFRQLDPQGNPITEFDVPYLDPVTIATAA